MRSHIPDQADEDERQDEYIGYRVRENGEPGKNAKMPGRISMPLFAASPAARKKGEDAAHKPVRTTGGDKDQHREAGGRSKGWFTAGA